MSSGEDNGRLSGEGSRGAEVVECGEGEYGLLWGRGTTHDSRGPKANGAGGAGERGEGRVGGGATWGGAGVGGCVGDGGRTWAGREPGRGRGRGRGRGGGRAPQPRAEGCGGGRGGVFAELQVVLPSPRRD